jgi:hypothetical protein
MKKYFAMMVAVLFLFGVVGLSFAQAPPIAAGDAKPAGPIDGKKSDDSKKRQEMTPEKKKAAEAPPIAGGQAKPDTKKVKKSDKSKKRQAQTEEKKKASEAPVPGKLGESGAAKP